MSVYLETTVDSLRTLIIATWPEVEKSGVLEAEHIEQIAWATIAPPFAVILLDELAETDDWGTANETYIANPQIFYVGNVKGDNTPIYLKLENLRDAFWQVGITSGQILKVAGLNVSKTLEVNATFAAKNMTQRAGRLEAEILVGETL